LFVLVALGPLAKVGGAWPPALSLAARGAGLLLMAGGGLFGLAALLHLGRNLSPLPHPTDDATLVDYGAYRLVRYPIYGGLIAASFGWGLFTHSVVTLLLAAVLFAFFDVKARREEHWLEKRLPAYAEYRRRVRKFIPWVY
jgi:protein-S-isoprenylcysteine O-methyltransferase Ste14